MARQRICWWTGLPDQVLFRAEDLGYSLGQGLAPNSKPRLFTVQVSGRFQNRSHELSAAGSGNAGAEVESRWWIFSCLIMRVFNLNFDFWYPLKLSCQG